MTKLGTSFAILEYLIEALLRLENAKNKISQDHSKCECVSQSYFICLWSYYPPYFSGLGCDKQVFS